ncbi:MAG: adenylosuccinate lyase, partial [Parcubacteria group bacterium]|nr:adenylosuccinate lyase [Parcubacteria group bacterium]
ERGCALSRQTIAELMAAYFTHMNQWLERTLDDSAGKRIYVPASFLCADAALNIIQFLFEGLVVYPAMINRHLREELPFMVTGKIIVAMVRTAGANRQECHERLRVLSQQASDNVKQRGLDNDLITRIQADSFFAPIRGMLDEIMDPSKLIGRSPEIVEEFITEEVDPLLAPFVGAEFMKERAEIHV